MTPARVTTEQAIEGSRAYFNRGRCSGHSQFNGRYCRDVAGPERWCIHCAGFVLLDALISLTAQGENERLKCSTCGKEAACIGRYEGNVEFTAACDTCCGHGNEDGECFQLVNEDGEYLTLAEMLGYLNKSEKQSAATEADREAAEAALTADRQKVSAQIQRWKSRRESIQKRIDGSLVNEQYLAGLRDAVGDCVADMETLHFAPTEIAAAPGVKAE